MVERKEELRIIKMWVDREMEKYKGYVERSTVKQLAEDWSGGYVECLKQIKKIISISE